MNPAPRGKTRAGASAWLLLLVVTMCLLLVPRDANADPRSKPAAADPIGAGEDKWELFEPEPLDPSLVALGAELHAPQVLLIPRVNTLPSAENFLGSRATTGVAISADRVVVSTVGLSAQFDARLRESPDRLAVKVATSLRDQFWHVLSWNGEVRSAKLVLISEAHQIAVLELRAPFADEPPELQPRAPDGDVEVKGLIDTGEGQRIGTLELPAQRVGEGLALLLAPAPTTFEGGLVFDRRGQPAGLLVGAATPGSPLVMGPAAIERAVAEATPPTTSRLDLRWSAAAGLGTAFFHDLGTSPAVVTRAELVFARRFSAGFEGTWTRDTFARLEATSPTFATSVSRRDRFVLAGVGEYLFGPPSSRLRIGTALGAGARLGRVDATTTTVEIPDGCGTGGGCELSASRSSGVRLESRFVLVGGLDFLNIGDGPWGSLAGARVGYRMHLELPSPATSQHLITVQLQL